MRSQNGLKSEVLGFIQWTSIDGAEALVEEAHMERRYVRNRRGFWHGVRLGMAIFRGEGALEGHMLFRRRALVNL
jgi:hypothetical protein